MSIEQDLEAAFGGRLTIERELGGGGMSRVFVARERHPAREVVVKVLPPDLVHNESADRFRREIDVAAKLQHPHIVPLLEVGRGDHLLAYSMPLVEGISLREKLTQSGALPISEAVRLWRDLLDALAYAHRRGVVHRDVKPENILVSSRHALITDFGVARALSEMSGGERMTGTGLAIGTPAYMAPEQAAGDRDVDHRADLYAAGLVMWEMLSGRHPYVGMSPSQMLVAHMTKVPEPLGDVRQSTPPVLAKLVAQCLAKEPADRPVDVDSVLSALEGINISEVVTPQATIAGVAPAARTRAPRRRLLQVAIGAAIVAAIAFALTLKPSAPTASDEATAALGGDSIRAVVLIPRTPLVGPDSSLIRGVLQIVTSELETIRNAVIVVPDQTLDDRAQRQWGMAPLAVFSPDTLTILARRGGTHAMIYFDISRVGDGVAFTATAFPSRDGAPLARATESANGPQEYLAATRRLAASLRKQLEDTLPFLERGDVGGFLSTTATAAVDQMRRGDAAFDRARYLEAAKHFELAVSLDPSFAMGYRQLALAYNNLGIRRHDRLVAIRRARELSDNARPFERVAIVGSYYSQLGQRDSGYTFYQAEREKSPRNTRILSNLASIETQRRRYAAAETWVRASLAEVPPTFVVVMHSNLLRDALAQGRLATGDSMFRANPALAPSLRGRQMRISQQVAQRRYDVVDSILGSNASDTGTDRRLSDLTSRQELYAVRGQLTRADSVSRELEALLEANASAGDALRVAAQRIELRALFGVDSAGIGAQYDALLARYNVQAMPPADVPHVRLASAALALGRVAEAERWITAWRRDFPVDARGLDQWDIDRTAALVELARGNARRALQLAQAGDSGACEACTQPTLARALEAAGDTVGAERVWKRYLQALSVGRAEEDQVSLARTLRLLGERAEARGNTREALAYYDELLQLWKDADPALQRLLDPVRSRVQRLRALRG